MDSFLLLRRLVAAIVFKGQTVSDYWWSRRTIFLTKLRHAPQKEGDEKSCVTFLLCDPGWFVQRT